MSQTGSAPWTVLSAVGGGAMSFQVLFCRIALYRQLGQVYFEIIGEKGVAN